MQPRTSRDIPKVHPHDDKQRDTERAVVQDGEKTDQSDRDQTHGDGGTIGIHGK